MSGKKQNLSDYIPESIPDAKAMRFGIVVSEWNPGITGNLLAGAMETLLQHGALEKNILVRHVPGSFELPLAAKLMITNAFVDAVICLGCVIQGETRHFEFICQAVSNAIAGLSLDLQVPVIFGVLTTDTVAQAEDRSGGKHGNKGTEAAIAAIKMTDLRWQLMNRSL